MRLSEVLKPEATIFKPMVPQHGQVSHHRNGCRSIAVTSFTAMEAPEIKVVSTLLIALRNAAA